MAEFTLVLRSHADTPIGEIQPNGLSFEFFINEVGTMQFNLPLVHSLAKREKIQPYVTDYYLYRNATLLQGGMITSLKMTNDSEMLEIAGKDWMHYLSLRQHPFDPDLPTKYKFQRKNKDVYSIIEDFLSVALGEAYSLPMTYHNGSIGATINYKIDLADTEDLLSKIENLSNQDPGFDYIVTPFREFQMFSPQKGSFLNYPLVKDVNIYKISITDNGPKGNHLLAQGAGTAKKLTKTVDSTVSKALYRRIDYAQDYGNLVDPALLTNKAKALQNYSKHPLFEFDITMLPQVTDDVYEQLALGDTVPVTGDFGYMSFDAQPHRIVNMKGSVNDQGDEELVLGVNDVPNGLLD